MAPRPQKLRQSLGWRPLESLEARTLLAGDAGYAAGVLGGGSEPLPENIALHATAATQVLAANYGAVGNGVANDAPAIQAAINAAPNGAVVLLEAGRTYRLGSPLTLTRSVSLNGQGATLLLSVGVDRFIDISATPSGTVWHWNQDVVAGQNTLALAVSPALLPVGSWVLVSLGDQGGQPAIQRVARVLANDGSRITLNRPVPFAVSGAGQHSLQILTAAVQSVSIRNLAFALAPGAAPAAGVRAFGAAGLTLSGLSGDVGALQLTACQDVRLMGITARAGAAGPFLALTQSEAVNWDEGTVDSSANQPAVRIGPGCNGVSLGGLELRNAYTGGALDAVLSIAPGGGPVRLGGLAVRTSTPARLLAGAMQRVLLSGSLTLDGWYSELPMGLAGRLLVNGTEFASAADVALPVVPLLPPGIPQGLEVSNTTKTTVSLAWQAVNGATGYRVERSADGQTFTPVGTTASATTWTDDGLAEGTTYTYRLRAFNTAGDSLPTTTVSARTRTGLHVGFGSSGITSLVYNGVSTLNLAGFPGDGYAVRSYRVLLPDGSNVERAGTFDRTGVAVDVAGRTITWYYTWGAVACHFLIAGDQLTFHVTVTNHSADQTILGVIVRPLTIQFPRIPDGFSPGGPSLGWGTDSPTVIKAVYGDDAVTLTNDLPGQPLYAGFMSSNQTASTNRYMLWIGSTWVAWQPGGWPKFDRAIGPGQTDAYAVSLRFGPAAVPVEEIAPEVYQEYREQNPALLEWNDRRPIGVLHVASTGAAHRSATNPGAWLFDPSINIFTPAGLESWRTRMLQYADTAVANLLSVNAQGAIVWSIEGMAWWQASYVGAPDLATTAAPELDYRGTVDEFFARFRDAGLRVGVTIRPSEVQFVGGVPSQVPSANPLATLLRKATYAHERWGATLFYVDSNLAADGSLLPSSVFRGLMEALPGCLFIPEHEDVGYYAVTAPYRELRWGQLATPAEALLVSPQAFGVINLADSNYAASLGPLLEAVQRGDILMFNAWGNLRVDEALLQLVAASRLF